MFSLLILMGATWASHGRAADCSGLLLHSFPSLQTGEPQNLCQYQGKVILVVNTASYCAFTDQFGGQETGNNKQIPKFCRLTYSVKFPMFEKSGVSGAKRNALFTELDRRTGQQPYWNFHKYLIDRSGNRVTSFESAVQPDDKRLLEALHKMLDTRKTIIRST